VIEGHTAGDPMSGKKWSRRDTRALSQEMKAEGVSICPNTVGTILKDHHYRLRVNRKSIAETHHPDRDQQFGIIAQTRKQFEDEEQPSLSVDSKKKELVGNFKNNGRAWSRQSQEVFVHDFRSQADALAVPYGLFEPSFNRGTVVVGTSYDTPQFAVDCVELWLNEWGWKIYPNLKKLLLLCDSGGSNGYRPRLWKYKLYTQIACRYGIAVRVCHYPPGASKWNPVEHRLFSFISMKWAGHPLRSLDLMLTYISGTTTKTGLEVNALLNTKTYEKGIKVSDVQFKEICIEHHAPLPAWNYTISPNSPGSTGCSTEQPGPA
jgi:hypothetical protein